MSKKKCCLFLLAIVILMALAYGVYLSAFSVPALNLSPLDDGGLPVLSLQWDGDTLRPSDSRGTVDLKAASVKLDFPNLALSVLQPTEKFLSEQLTPESLEKLLPTGHKLYGLLEFRDSYWLISGKQADKPYLAALGNFHQPDEAEHTVTPYKTFYRTELAALRGGGASLSSAYQCIYQTKRGLLF